MNPAKRKGGQIACGMQVPVEADPVDWPEVIYREGLDSINFQSDHDCSRVTFQGLDALRICRGECLAYEDNWSEEDPHYWVYTIQNSSWLIERHAYEAEHYRDCYEWGGDVDEMLTDFSHYLFTFHDQFVEAIAYGIWIESDTAPLAINELQVGHPLLPLSEDTITDRIKINDLVCQIRENPKPVAQLIEDSRFCDQPIIDFVIEEEGSNIFDLRLSLRNRNGNMRSELLGSLDRKEAEYKGVSTLNDVLPDVKMLMAQTAEYRHPKEK